MEAPKPGEAHQKLQWMVGSWSGEEKIWPSPWDPQGGTRTGRVQNRTALDGFIVVQDYAQEKDGAAVFHGHGVFSWDQAQSSHLMHWYDSMGMPPSEFRGQFEGRVLTMTCRGPMGHSRATFDFSTADHYRFRMEVSQDGAQWHPFMEGNYARQK